MPRDTRINALATAVGAQIKTLRTSVGTLANLTTGAKTDLVSAINEVRALAASAGGGSGPTTIAKAVTAARSESTLAGSAIPDFVTSNLAPGTYEVKAQLRWQSAAVGTGIAYWLWCAGGTTTVNVGHVYTTTTGGAATTGIADQATVAGTFQMIESRAWRANNTNPGAFGGVDTANSDQLAVLEAIIVVTVATQLQIVQASEVAGSAVTTMPGSSLKITQIA